MKYAAFVKDKETRERKWIVVEAKTKTQALSDIRKNGYSVSNKKCLTKNQFNYILGTDMESKDYDAALAIR